MVSCVRHINDYGSTHIESLAEVGKVVLEGVNDGLARVPEIVDLYTICSACSNVNYFAEHRMLQSLQWLLVEGSDIFDAQR